MNSKSKRQLRVADRFSELPDALLWHILSFSDTKDAVRTCILSTRWKNIWASVPTLDVCASRCYYDPAEFMAFVDHVLLLRYSSNIRKFRLHWGGIDVDHSRINAWIHAAIRRNVVEVDLCAGYPHELKSIFELPEKLFMCKSLVFLRLTSQFVISIPASGCFPSLKSLHVTFRGKANVSMFDVFSNCPILEDLTMDGYINDRNPLKLNIAAPALKTLRIFFSDGLDNYSYYINCPKLENFRVTEELSSKYYWGKAKSLVEVRICLSQHCSIEQPGFYHVTRLLAGVSNVTDLYLSAHSFEVGSLPAYENLRRLKLVIQDCFCWELLTELLKRSPVLESLVLEREVGSCLQEDSDEGSQSQSESEEGSDQEAGSENEQGSEHEGSEHQWNPPDCVPNCCLSHLKIVSIKKFTGKRDELEVAKYLLKYGQVLNKMTISARHLDVNESDRIYKELVMVSRGSRTSVVEFSRQF